MPPQPIDCSFNLTLKCPCDHWPNSIVIDFAGETIEEISPELEAQIIRAGELTKVIDAKVPDVPS